MSEAAAAAPTAAAGPPASTPSPDIPQSATVQAPFNDAFADLDKMVGEGGDESPPSDAPDAGAETTSSKSGSAEEGKKSSATDAQPNKSAPPKAEEKSKAPAPEPPIEKMAPKQLREAYQALKAKHAELQKERDAFDAKLKEPPKEDPEKKTLAERLAAREKRLQDIEGILRLKAFEESEPYKKTWLQPFVDAYSDGGEAAASIKVNGEDGEPRQGTAEDFDRYMRIADEDQASDFAEQVFGSKKGMMEYHRMQVLQKNRARLKAIEANKKEALDFEKQSGEQMQKVNGERKKLWDTSNENALKKYPQWFAPVDGDEKGNELLSRGMHLADRAFSSGQPLAEGDKPLSPQEMVALHSAVRNKAGAFDRLAHQHAQAKKEIAKLKAKIEEYQKSEPGKGDGKGQQAAQEGEGWEQKLESMATRR